MMMHETLSLTGVSNSGYEHHESYASGAASVATSPGGQPSPEVSLMNDMDAALVALDGGSGGMATLWTE